MIDKLIGLVKEWIRQYWKFAIVGGIGALFYLGLLWIFTEVFKIYYMTSAIIAIFTTSIWNFFANKYWTFKKND